MIELKDQMNRTIRLEKIPERIVSLVPSQTELLYDLGLGDRVIGITKFCLHPDAWYRSKIRVGGTKNLNLELIESLNPDLIIGNKEENTEAEISRLQQKFPVYMSDIFTVNDAVSMIHDIGQLTATVSKSQKISQQILNEMTTLPKLNFSVIYLIWESPYMAVGGKTFIGDVLRQIGCVNCIEGDESRYPQLTLTQIKEHQPDLILLSTEPFPFKEEHAVALNALTGIETILVDGEMFSWYGSRMLKMKAYFTHRFQHWIKDLPEKE